MNIHFKAFGLSYKKSAIQIREAVALSDSEMRNLLTRSKEVLGINEMLIISTCNRTEFYYVSENDEFDRLISLLGIEKNLSNIDSYKLDFEHFTSTKAVQHLFEVATGIDSQVLGDLQIINQVKKAYQASADNNMAQAFLHRLLHTIFFTNKKIVQQTTFRDGAASVSYAAVSMLEELTANMTSPQVLVIGTGEIGEDVLRNLKNTNFMNILVANRTFEKAESLAKELNYKAVRFEEIEKYIAESEIIISSVSMSKPLISKDLLEQNPILSFKFIVDLSIPRSVESKVEEIPAVLLYNMDSIEQKVSETMQKRQETVPAVLEIIAEAMAEFADWTQEILVSPVIQQFKNVLENIRKDEMSRFAKQMNPQETEVVDKITRNILQKIIKYPVLELKAACKRGEAENVSEMLKNLFDLEKQTEKVNH
ncbi:MAG: glutamyl-tRNA reductase [Bacteroidetes bacterium]|nr:MAG: glutamyl-tRNA reductase [Bacteroidota bacterium]